MISTELRPIRHDLAVFAAVDLFDKVAESELLRWYPGSTGEQFLAGARRFIQGGYIVAEGSHGDIIYRKADR